jgi:signal transduction histidine kinase
MAMDSNVKKLLDIIDNQDFNKKIMFEDNPDFQALYRIIRRSSKMNVMLEKNLQAMNDNLKDQVAEQVNNNRQKDQMLLQQSKLAIMGEMISMIAHQWRQPLSSIKMVSQSMQMKKRLGLLSDDLIDKSINDIVDLSNYMNNTIDDFRNFFKPSRELEVLNLADLIENSISFTKHSLDNNGIKVINNFENDVLVNIYRGEFTQVIINIVNNAKDALLDNKVSEPVIKINMTVDDDNVNIEVIDNGKGIPEDIIDSIFDPYFSTKGKNGTGLGLYMSKIIVEEHLEGSLTVSNYGDGAMFCIQIPIYKREN